MELLPRSSNVLRREDEQKSRVVSTQYLNPPALWPSRQPLCPPPSQGSRTRLAYYSSPLDAARSKDGAGPRRLMLGPLDAGLRFRRQLGRCRRSALLNVGPRLAARSPLTRRRRLSPPGSFRPSSRLRSSGARAKRKKLRIDGLHSPTVHHAATRHSQPRQSASSAFWTNAQLA